MVFWFAKLEQTVEIHPSCFLEIDIETRDGRQDRHTIWNHGDAVTRVRNGDFVKETQDEEEEPPVEEQAPVEPPVEEEEEE